MNLVGNTVNPDDGVNDVTHPSHGTKDYGVAARFVIRDVWREQNRSDGVVGKAMVEEARCFLRIREGADFWLLKRTEQDTEGLAAARAVPLEELS